MPSMGVAPGDNLQNNDGRILKGSFDASAISANLFETDGRQLDKRCLDEKKSMIYGNHLLMDMPCASSSLTRPLPYSSDRAA